MKRTNPKFTWREWLIAPAYEQAEQGDYSLVREIHQVLSHPYDEQSDSIQQVYDQPRPKRFHHLGGVAHYSCSS